MNHSLNLYPEKLQAEHFHLCLVFGEHEQTRLKLLWLCDVNDGDSNVVYSHI